MTIPQDFGMIPNLSVFSEVKKKKGAQNELLSFGDPPGARTQDPNIKSVVLYLLS